MRPKGKLFALVALFAAVGLITATGAFTTVEAERTATVDVAGDSSALLQIQSMSGVAEEGENGVLSVDLDDPGLNPNARTEFAPMLNVTNQGTNDNIELSVSVTTAEDGEIDADSIIVQTSDDETDLTSESVDLGTGDTVEIDLVFDLTDANGNQITELGDSEDITITFDAVESGSE